jgi:hypothetical protein
MKRNILSRSMYTAQHSSNYDAMQKTQEQSKVQGTSGQDFCVLNPSEPEEGMTRLTHPEIGQLVERHRRLTKELLAVRGRLYRLGVDPESFMAN